MCAWMAPGPHPDPTCWLDGRETGGLSIIPPRGSRQFQSDRTPDNPPPWASQGDANFPGWEVRQEGACLNGGSDPSTGLSHPIWSDTNSPPPPNAATRCVPGCLLLLDAFRGPPGPDPHLMARARMCVKGGCLVHPIHRGTQPHGRALAFAPGSLLANRPLHVGLCVVLDWRRGRREGCLTPSSVSTRIHPV